MKPGYVDRFPLKASFSTKREKEIYEQIIQTVKRINALSKAKSDVVRREVIALKEKIDAFLYELYGLTDEEKKIIEESLK